MTARPVRRSRASSPGRHAKRLERPWPRADLDGGETSATLTVVLSNQGDDCATCAAKSCLISGQTCEALGTAVAASGPSAGTERSTLCLDTLACLVDSSPD